LSCEKFQIKRIVSKSLFKRIFFSQPSFKKGLQKFIKSLPNWIQIPTPIHFPSLYYHLGISVPRLALENRIYPSINLPRFFFGLLHLCKCNSRSGTPVTRCHGFLQPSFTPHMSRSHLHVKHNSYTYTPNNP
jgi:hypothetical protein